MSHKISVTVNDDDFAWIEMVCNGLGLSKTDFVNLALRSIKGQGVVVISLANLAPIIIEPPAIEPLPGEPGDADQVPSPNLGIAPVDEPLPSKRRVR